MTMAPPSPPAPGAPGPSGRPGGLFGGALRGSADRSTGQEARRPAGTGSSVADRRVMTVITVLLVAITVFQRFGAPLGGVQLSVSVLVAFAGLGYLLYHGDLVENPGATRVFVLAMAACFAVAAVVLVRTGVGGVTSLLYLPVVWMVFCFRLHPARHHLYERVLDRFEKLMVLFAVVGILQTVLQAARLWSYQDFILTHVPKAVLFTGYNTSYPIEYGNPIIKANGFVFLEPSVYGQFLAVALLSALVRRAHWFRALLTGVALVCTISGTGLLFVAFGIAVLAVRRGGRWTARIVAALVVGGAVALTTPFGEIIASRAGETSETNSSGSLRFVQPYERILDSWSTDPATVLLGKGAGYADALANEIFTATGLPINFSGFAKLLMEYGVVATVLFSVFVALAVVRRAPAPTLALSAVFANAFLTGALLQPQVLYLMVPLCSLFIGYRFEGDLDDQKRARSQTLRPSTDDVPGVRVTVAPADPNGRGGA